MAKPISNISSLYTRFNQNFESARESSPSELSKYLDVLCTLQDAITAEAEKTSTLPEKITSKDELLKQLSAKISLLVEKDFKHKPADSSSTTPVYDCVGIGNRSGFSQLSNCWVNSLIQMSVHNPVHARVFRVVGHHYSQDVNPQLRQAGRYLLDAIDIYEQRIADAQRTHQKPVMIPHSVSQNVRIACHLLFGIDQDPRSQQDAHDAIMGLRTRYEEIERQRGGFPCPGYSPMGIRSTYRPKPGVGPELRTVPRDTYTEPRTSQKHDFQLELEAAEVAQDLPIETLVSNYCNQTGGPDVYFMAADGVRQQLYECTHKQTYFTGAAPQTLTLVVKRNRYNTVTGQAEKVHKRVNVGRILALPAQAMQANDRMRAYELISFIVHTGVAGGGHYITYKKTPEGWVECNDGSVRRMSDTDIDAILRGSTPYVLDYRIVSTAQQDAMLLQRAAELNVQGPQPQAPLSKELAELQKLIDQLVKVEQLLQKPDSSNKQIIESLQSLNGLSKLCLPLISQWTAFHNNMTDQNDGLTLLYSNPKQLSSIKTGWLRNSSENIISQLIRIEREKFAIRKAGEELEALETAALKSGATKLQLEAVKKKQLEFNQLVYRYNLENLKTFHVLLKNEKIGNEQLKRIFEQLDIPDSWVKQIYAVIEKATGKSDGKAQFEAHPRILSQSSLDLLASFISSLR